MNDHLITKPQELLQARTKKLLNRITVLTEIKEEMTGEGVNRELEKLIHYSHEEMGYLEDALKVLHDDHLRKTTNDEANDQRGEMPCHVRNSESTMEEIKRNQEHDLNVHREIHSKY